MESSTRAYASLFVIHAWTHEYIGMHKYSYIRMNKLIIRLLMIIISMIILVKQIMKGE